MIARARARFDVGPMAELDAVVLRASRAMSLALRAIAACDVLETVEGAMVAGTVTADTVLSGTVLRDTVLSDTVLRDTVLAARATGGAVSWFAAIAP